MAIQIQGSGGVMAEVDGTTFRALRVTARPVNFGSLGSHRLGMASGIIAAALAANSELFQFRWPDATNLALVHHIDLNASANIAATAAVSVSIAMVIARGWTGIGTGGLRAVLTGNIGKLRTSFGTSLVSDAGIATTAALGAGTKTIDHATNNFAEVAIGIGTGAITTTPNLSLLPENRIFDAADQGDCPIIFTQNEGFIIRNGVIAWPATMTWKLCVNVGWSEAASF